MTLAEARAARADTRFERTSDGDGVALVVVKLDTTDLVILYAAEDDPEKPVDWSRPVNSMETFHPGCRTADGIHPGSLVTDVERVLGTTTGIVVSEIESRQYIRFQRMPTRTSFRLDYTGIFEPGRRETMRNQPGARIFSITVGR